METTLEFIKIIALFVLLTYYGFLLITQRKGQFEKILIPVYITLAIVVISLSYFFLGYLKLPFVAINAVIFLIPVMFYFLKRPSLSIGVNKGIILPLIFSILGVFILASFSFPQGFDNTNRLIIYNANNHDSLWHIALQESIKKSIPPVNPVYSPNIIKGYHYLTDIFLSWISVITNITSINIYLKWSPIILAMLWTSSTLLLFFKISKDKVLSYLAAAMVLFASNFVYLTHFFYPGVSGNQSIFWLDQSVLYLVNQQLVLSLIILNTIFILMLESIKRYWILIGILLGSLAGIKIYGLVVTLPIFGLIGIWYVIKEKDYSFIKSTVIGVILSSILVFIQGNNLGFPFVFLPGWFIQTMFEAPDKLNYSVWEIHRQLFTQTQNWIRLSLHWISGFLILLVGNYGLKVLGLVFLIFALKRKLLKDKIFYISVISIVISILLPMIFIQKGVIWNSIQFMYFASLPMVILILILGREILSRKYLIIIFMTIILLNSPTTVYELVKDYHTSSYGVYPANIINGLKVLRDKDLDNFPVITGSGLYEWSLVPAIVGSPIYYGDQVFYHLLGIDSSDRRRFIEDLESKRVNCPTNTYLVLKGNLLDVASSAGEVIYTNEDIVISKCK